jgi:hypothetical protein
MAENPSKRPVGRPRKTFKPDEVKPKKPPTPASFGQDNLEPGDNAKYLGHALTISRLPLVDINDANAVAERIDLYFQLCFENDMKPTVSGLCNALSIRRNTIMTWKNGTFREDTHQAVILKAYAMLETLWEDYMQNGKINPVSGIFLGKNNFGYQDKQEHVVIPATGTIEAADVATIEAKYAELPDVKE